MAQPCFERGGMKPSEYNVFHKEDNTLFVYNTLSGAAIALSSEYAKLFETPGLWSDDKVFLENMAKGGFLISDDIDEKEFIRKSSAACRFDETGLAYTIAPTLACNFRCPYCYEVEKVYSTMTAECIDKTICYISGKLEETNAKHLQIAWYGGEPLLHMKAIEHITKAVRRKDVKYVASIVTNGYFLSGGVAKMLSDLGVEHAQVTVDGPPDIHNVRRCLPSGQDTFFRILNNIKDASNYLKITIRVNVDRANAQRLDEIVHHFDQFDLKGKVRLYLAPVNDINGSCTNGSCLAMKEFSDYEVAFLRKHIDSGYTYAYLPAFNPSICGAVRKDAEIIDPLGDLYKCWNEVGMKQWSYGSIYEDCRNSNLDKWSDYDYESYEECGKCVFLPTCMGGCPHENLIEKRRACDSIKENYTEMIGLVRDYKKTRENRIEK